MRWLLDSGDALATPRAAPDFIESKQAICTGKPGAAVTAAAEGDDMMVGMSRDQTLNWTSIVRPDGSRSITVRLWDGDEMATVIDDRIAAPKQP